MFIKFNKQTSFLLVLATFILILFSAFSYQTDKQLQAISHPTLNLGDSVDGLIQQLQQKFGSKGINLTLGVVKDGQVLLKKNYGYANPVTKTKFSERTQIYLASTSKSLTGTLAAILDHQNLIKLEGTIADYLPGFTFDDKNLHPDQITIRSLMTHTHGIKSNDFVIWTAFIGHQGNEQLLALLKKYSTALPNQNFNYSNVGPVIYSLIVEKKLGKPWQQVMDTYLFKPLGMTATTAYVSKVNPKYISYVIDQSTTPLNALFDKADNSMAAAGGHLSTIADLLKYTQFFLSSGQSVPGVLTEKEINVATSAIVAQKSRYQSYERLGYGLGWEQSIFNGEQVVSRFGGYSGISSHLSFMKAHQIGIVVLSNTKGMEALPHLLANYIYNTLLNKANKPTILQENLTALSKGIEADRLESKEIQEAMQLQLVMDKNYAGIYDGGDKSGTMKIDPKGNVQWGNLKGQLIMQSDSTGLINFNTMVRSFSVKKEAGTILGVYSNERYFKR